MPTGRNEAYAARVRARADLAALGESEGGMNGRYYTGTGLR